MRGRMGTTRWRVTRQRITRVLAGLVTLLVTGLLSAQDTSAQPMESAAGPSARAEANGLVLSMRITPGPYFLGELITADLRLENHSRFIYAMAGSNGVSPCGALQVQIVGGTPSGRLYPTRAWSYCPLIISQLHPGEVWTRHQAIALDATGWAHIEASANVMGIMRDGQLPDGYANPFGETSPGILAYIAPHAPANRQLTLQAAGNSVSVVLSSTARTHPYYGDLVTCDDANGPGNTQMSTDGLYETTTTTFTEPGCSGIHEVWRYWVGVVGYDFAGGRTPATAPAVSR